jgi:uncharacterized protein (TIGR02996 family)
MALRSRSGRPPKKRPDQTTTQLWQEILKAPDDLEARAVFADRLMEQGNPLGEFVQLSLALERAAEDDVRRAHLEEHAATLRRAHIFAWTRTIVAVPGLLRRRLPDSSRFALGRGLVEHIVCHTCTVSALPEAAKVAPVVSLKVTRFAERSSEVASWASQLSAMPELSQIRRLELSGIEHETDALRVLTSPNLRRLERLVISGPTTPRLARIIAGAPACSELGELILEGHKSGIGVEGAAALAALPLRSLVLRNQYIGRDGAAAFARTRTLRSLAIAGERLGEAVRGLVSDKTELSDLCSLSLDDCALGERGLVALAASAALPALRVLELTGANGVNGETFTAMAEAWALPALRALRLQGPLQKEGAALLADLVELDGLEALSLSGGLEDRGAATLASWAPSRLTSLKLHASQLGPAGLAALAKGRLLGRVRELELVGSPFGNEGGKVLAKARWLEGLQRLHLSGNAMEAAGLRAVVERTPRLETLWVGDNHFESEALLLASRGILPKLRTLQLDDPVDPLRLDGFLESGHAIELGSLSIHGTPIRKRAAELLAALPCLERLHFSSCDISPDAVGRLYTRRAGLVTAWPDVD